MEVWRRISAGRLAEMFGAGSDRRRTGSSGPSAGASRRSATSMPLAPEARSVLDAYTRRGQRLARWPSRLARSGVPRGRRHARAVDGPRHDRVGQGPGVEPRRQLRLRRSSGYLADARLGDPARTDELFPAYREDAPVITPTGLPGSGWRRGTMDRLRSGAGSTAIASPETSRPIAPAEAAAWRSIAGLGQSLLRTAGLDAADGLASDHGIGSNDWVVGPGMSQTGGALLANDPHLGISMPSIWFINGLHCRTVSDACPYDVAGVSFPGRPGRRPRAQRAHRVGRHQHRPRRPGPRHREGRPCGPERLHPRRGVHSVRRPPRTDQGVRGGAVRPRDPIDGPRPDPQRRRRATEGRPTMAHPLDGEPRAGPDVRGASSVSTRRRASRTSASRSPSMAPRRRTSSTPTSTATSATSSRATSRSARTPTTAAIARSAATTAAVSGRAASRSTTCRGSSIRRTA